MTHNMSWSFTKEIVNKFLEWDKLSASEALVKIPGCTGKLPKIWHSKYDESLVGQYIFWRTSYNGFKFYIGELHRNDRDTTLLIDKAKSANEAFKSSGCKGYEDEKFKIVFEDDSVKIFGCSCPEDSDGFWSFDEKRVTLFRKWDMMTMEQALPEIASMHSKTLFDQYVFWRNSCNGFKFCIGEYQRKNRSTHLRKTIIPEIKKMEREMRYLECSGYEDENLTSDFDDSVIPPTFIIYDTRIIDTHLWIFDFLTMKFFSEWDQLPMPRIRLENMKPYLRSQYVWWRKTASENFRSFMKFNITDRKAIRYEEAVKMNKMMGIVDGLATMLKGGKEDDDPITREDLENLERELRDPVPCDNWLFTPENVKLFDEWDKSPITCVQKSSPLYEQYMWWRDSAHPEFKRMAIFSFTIQGIGEPMPGKLALGLEKNIRNPNLLLKPIAKKIKSGEIKVEDFFDLEGQLWNEVKRRQEIRVPERKFTAEEIDPPYTTWLFSDEMYDLFYLWDNMTEEEYKKTRQEGVIDSHTLSMFEQYEWWKAACKCKKRKVWMCSKKLNILELRSEDCLCKMKEVFSQELISHLLRIPQ